MPASFFKPMVHVIEKDGEYIVIEGEEMEIQMLEDFKGDVMLLKEEYFYIEKEEEETIDGNNERKKEEK